MANNQVHVTFKNNAWHVSLNGVTKNTFGDKASAEAYGRTLAKANNAELVVHNMDGKIGGKNSYGNDPFPPRG